MTDIAQTFSQLLAQSANGNNNDSSFEKPKNDFIKMNKSNSPMVRILPLPSGVPFQQFEAIFLTIEKKDGSKTQTRVFFSSNPQEQEQDKLYKLIKKVVEYNYRNLVNGDTDPVPLNPENKFSKHAKLATGYEVWAVNINVDSQGTSSYEVDSTGYPIIRGMELKSSAFNGLLTTLANNDPLDPTPNRIDGTPFPSVTDGEGWGYIDIADSFPVRFHLPEGKMAYDVKPYMNIHLGAFPTNYADKGADGKYLHADDLEYFAGPTKETAPDYYEFIYNQINDRAKAVPGLADIVAEVPVTDNDLPFTMNEQVTPTSQVPPTTMPTQPVQPQVQPQVQAQSVAPTQTFQQTNPWAGSDTTATQNFAGVTPTQQEPVQQPTTPATPVTEAPTEAPQAGNISEILSKMHQLN